MRQRREAVLVKPAEGGLLPAFLLLGLWAAFLLVPDTQLLDLKRGFGFLWVAVAFALLGIRIARGEAVALPARGLGLVLTALVLIYVVAALSSPYPNAASYRLEVLALGVLLAWFAAGLGEAFVERWSWVTLACTALIALYALLQRFGFDSMTAYRLAGSHERATGPFGNANALAAFLCFAWPLVLLSARGRLGLCLLLGLALFATQSRAGILALGVQLAVLAMQAWREGLRPRRGMFGLGLFAFVAASLVLFPAQEWLRPTLRIPLWAGSLALSAQRLWLGWGPGSFALAFPEHGSEGINGALGATQFAEHPHSWVLSILHEAGALGLLAWAWLLAFIRPWPSKQAPRNPLQRAVALGLLGLLVENSFDKNLDQAALSSCFFFGVGLLYQGTFTGPTIRARWRAGLYFFGACVIAGMGLRPWMAYHGAVTAPESELGPSVEELSLAGERSPTDAVALDRLGFAYVAQGNYTQAVTVFDRAFALQATLSRAQNIGNCLMQMGRPADAEGRYRMALLLGPATADLHFNLGYALFYQKKLKFALAELDAALTLEPGHAAAAKLKEQILR